MKRRFKRYVQHKGAILPISHDFSPYVNQHSVTLSTAASQNASSGLSITSEATASNVWSALVGAASTTGNLNFELKGTFSDGSVQLLEFEIVVYDD